MPNENHCIVCGKLLVSDYDSPMRTTCDKKCHEVLVSKLETAFGKYKKIVDEQTKVAYKVPTRYIVERGLSHDELSKFPLWEDS